MLHISCPNILRFCTLSFHLRRRFKRRHVSYAKTQKASCLNYKQISTLKISKPKLPSTRIVEISWNQFFLNIRRWKVELVKKSVSLSTRYFITKDIKESVTFYFIASRKKKPRFLSMSIETERNMIRNWTFNQREFSINRGHEWSVVGARSRDCDSQEHKGDRDRLKWSKKSSELVKRNEAKSEIWRIKSLHEINQKPESLIIIGNLFAINCWIDLFNGSR